MTDTANLALIGAGYWGKNLARNFHALGALRTICDPASSLLAKYKEQYPELVTTSELDEVFADPAITQVAIAAPAVLHYDLASRAIASGKDVYVEKPLCLAVTDAEALTEQAAAAGKILMVGHLLQYHPMVVRMQELVGSGVIGKLQYLTANRLNLGKIRQEENALWSFAPHDLSVILSLVGHQVPELVRCSGGSYLTEGVEDVAITTMRFASGVRAHVHVNWLNPFKEQRFVAVGSAGMLVFDDTRSWAEKLALYHQPVTWSDGVVPMPNKQEPDYVSVPEGEPLKAECQHFLDSCRERKAPKTDGGEGVRVLRVLQAATVSLKADGEAVDPAAISPVLTDVKVHSTAVADPGSRIGAGTRVWHFSHIMSDCDIGERCSIGQNVVVSPGVRLGSNVKVQNNVSIYTGVICEDDVFLGPSMVFTNVINPRSAIPRRDQYRKTIVGRGATIGANATIICGNNIGHHAFVGAGAVVSKDVPPYALVVGNPARQVGWMSEAGGKLTIDMSAEIGAQAQCPESGERYRLTASGLERVI